MKINQFFSNHPVFRYEEFYDFMKKTGVDKPTSCRQLLSYHHKTGRLSHIRRLLYAVKPQFADENFWVDPYLIAANASSDAVLAYHSALELHELAYTTFEELTYLTQQSSKPFSYQGQQFRSVAYPKALLLKNKVDWGVTEIKRQGLTIKITNLERTIVDVLDRPDLAGGWEEICRSLDHIVNINLPEIVEYTLLLENATTTAKVGFFLEQLPSYLAVDSKQINKLLPHIPNQPHPLDRSRRGKGKYIKKWQIIVPLEVIERQWEEPDDSRA